MKRRMKRDAVVQPQDQSIRYIPLTQGKIAVVDAADFDWLSQWNWHAWLNRKRTWYAKRNVRTENTTVSVYMHRAIMNPPDDAEIDHRDGDGLNNKRFNLRVAAHSQNMQNQCDRRNNTSGFRGVTQRKSRWIAQIGLLGGGKEYLGRFPTPEAAARAYDVAASKHFGTFARLNFPTESH